MDEEKYINGFNHGYSLGRENPKLLEKLLSVQNPESSYVAGLKAGGNQFSHERAMQFHDSIQEKRQKNKQSKRKGRGLR